MKKEFIALNMVFTAEESFIPEAKLAIEKCRTAAAAEVLSISKARQADPIIDEMLRSLESSGDFDNSFNYIVLRNVRAVCDDLGIHYIRDAEKGIDY